MCDKIKASPLSVKCFYKGSTKKEFLHQLVKKRLRNEQVKLYKLRPLPSADRYKPCFDERIIWKWFPRQQFALDYCKKTNDVSLCLFAFETDDGKRKYLVTTQRQFWSRYCLMNKKYHHFYEVIRLTDACRLYFDIEYQYEFNSCVDGTKLLQLFIHMICCCLFTTFQIKCTSENIIDLESSSETKFSHHLIFHFKDRLFSNNISCGNFVKDVMECLKLYLKTGVSNRFFPVVRDLNFEEENQEIGYLTMEESRQLIVQSEHGDTFLCDLSVYTKNRNFRLYLSSKVSKNIPLVISNNNKFVFKKKLYGIERELFKIRNEKFDPGYQLFADTLVCPEERKCVNLITYGDDANTKSYNVSDMSSENGANEQGEYPQFVEGFNVSPYPMLDKFILNIVKKTSCPGNESCPGVIRRWMYYRQSGLMIYDIGNNKWCGNIQRQHKSNHVYYVADLKFCHIYQKCHDPDCAGFRSKQIPIPNEINPLANDDKDEIEDFDISIDEELNEFLSEEFAFDQELNKGDSLVDDHKLKFRRKQSPVLRHSPLIHKSTYGTKTAEISGQQSLHNTTNMLGAEKVNHIQSAVYGSNSPSVRNILYSEEMTESDNEFICFDFVEDSEEKVVEQTIQKTSCYDNPVVTESILFQTNNTIETDVEANTKSNPEFDVETNNTLDVKLNTTSNSDDLFDSFQETEAFQNNEDLFTSHSHVSSSFNTILSHQKNRPNYQGYDNKENIVHKCKDELQVGSEVVNCDFNLQPNGCKLYSHFTTSQEEVNLFSFRRKRDNNTNAIDHKILEDLLDNNECDSFFNEL